MKSTRRSVWFAIAMTIALFVIAPIVLAIALPGCGGGSLRTQSQAISNRAADFIDAGTHTMLALYCVDNMAAVGRTGTLVDGHCRPSGPRAGTPATETEAAALAAVRTRWAPILAAREVVTRAHDTLRGLIEATGSISDGQILAAVGDLAASYESMRQAAIAAGIAPPPPLSLEAP